MNAFFQRLLGRKEPPVESIKTAPLSNAQTAAESCEPIKYSPPHLVVGIGQSVGLQRETNEDSLFSLNTALAGNNESVTFGIFIVADGMGGHEHGEIASGVAIRSIASHLVKKLYLPFFGLNSTPLNEPVQEILQEGMRQAQQAVMRFAPGGGTTLTSVFILGEQLTLAHIGDSRAYFVSHDGGLEVITRDHTLVRRLQELGQITENEAANHPQRNILYRAIGQGEVIEADINTNPLPHRGRLLLCTDGLWGVLPEKEIIQIINTSTHPSAACHRLVEAANQAGGPDNISVILVELPG